MFDVFGGWVCICWFWMSVGWLVYDVAGLGVYLLLSDGVVWFVYNIFGVGCASVGFGMVWGGLFVVLRVGCTPVGFKGIAGPPRFLPLISTTANTPTARSLRMAFRESSRAP